MDEKPRRKPGRPKGTVFHKFTEEIVEEVLKGIRLGMSYKDSALTAGISEGAWHKWLAKGRKGIKPFNELVDRCAKAVEEAKRVNLGLVNMTARPGQKSTKTTTEYDKDGNLIKTVTVTEDVLPNLRAVTWLLERRHPKEFGPKQEVALSNGENPFEVNLFSQALVGAGNPEEAIEGEGE